MPPAVSVIIPVYNAGKYLAECLDSVCAQTLREIEIICVDDGSTDGSPAILAEYAARDERIKVVSQDNAGAGAARNTGIGLASGEYLAFIDADDFWKPPLLKSVWDQVRKFDADIGLYPNAVYDDRTGRISDTQFAGWLPDRQPFAPAEYADRLFQMTAPAPGYRLYRREPVIEKKLAFLPQHIAEDIYFVFLAMAFAEKICYIRDVYAFLRRGQEGNLSSSLERYPRETHDSLMQIRKRLEEAGLYGTFSGTFRTAAIASSEYIFWHVPPEVLPMEERRVMLAELGIADKESIIAWGGSGVRSGIPGKAGTFLNMLRTYGAEYTLRYLFQTLRKG